MKKIIALMLSVVLIIGNSLSILAGGGIINFTKLYLIDDNDNYEPVTSNVIALSSGQTNITIKRTDAAGEINIAGVGISILNSNDDIVTTFVTGNAPQNLIGVLAVGETYTIRETSPVSGHTPEVAEKEITIEDTSDEQIFIIKDKAVNPETTTEEPTTPELTTEEEQLEGKCGVNAFWSLDKKTGVLNITGSGKIRDYYYHSSPLYNVYEYIQSVNISEGITGIGNYFFADCENITEVNIPHSVTTIGFSSFDGCSSLAEVNIPDSVTNLDTQAFSFCGLTSVAVPASVTTIGARAFSFNTKMTDIYIYSRECSIDESIHTIPASAIIHGYTGSTAQAYAEANNRTFVPFDEDETTTEEPTTIEKTTEEQTTVKPTDEPTTAAPMTEEPTTVDSAPEADFKIASKTLALSSGISLVFKVNKSLFENRYKEPKLVVLLDGFETEITEYTDEGSRYAFEFTKITPDKMNVMVEATLHATKNGKEYVSPVTEYSVATYAYNMLNKYGETAGMETFRTLLVDLLNYGTASQNYTGFNTDNPANGELTATQKSWASGDLGELTSVKNNKYATIDNPSVLWKSAGLALQDAVIVKMKIQADSTDGLIVRVIDDYGTAWNIEPKNFEPAVGTDNQYYVNFKGFNVGRMSESMYFTVLRDGKTVSNTYRYSVESYVLQYMDNDGPLGSLVVAMMKYGKSAQAYSS